MAGLERNLSPFFFFIFSEPEICVLNLKRNVDKKLASRVTDYDTNKANNGVQIRRGSRYDPVHGLATLLSPASALVVDLVGLWKAACYAHGLCAQIRLLSAFFNLR